jgi:PAS domain S-box-containing protein
MTPLWISLALSSASMLALIAVYAWQQRRVPGGRALTGLLVALAWWSLSYGLMLLLPGLMPKTIALKAQFFGIVAIPVLWLMFCLRTTSDPKWLDDRRVKVALWIIPVLTIGFAWSNDLHKLMYGALALSSVFPDTIAAQFGPWFALHALYSFALLFAGCGVLIRTWIGRTPLYRSQINVWLAAAAPPIVANLAFLLNWPPLRGLDVTPLVMGFSGLCFAYGLFRYRLTELEPVALEAAFENIPDAVLVLDSAHRITRANPAAFVLLGMSRNAVGRPAARYVPQWELLLKRSANLMVGTSVRLQQGDRFLEARINAVRERHNRSIGTLVILNDISELVRYQEHMEELAFRDALTGLSNRRDFFARGGRRLELAQAHRQPKRLALLYIDRRCAVAIGGCCVAPRPGCRQPLYCSHRWR